MTDNNTDIKDTWIDVETLAKLKNITKRAVRLSLNQNKYEYKTENIRGGKTYKIKLSTIIEYILKMFGVENVVFITRNLLIRDDKKENLKKIIT